MKLRCPCCHASNSLEAFVADDAGRELLRRLAGTGPLFRPLVTYLGLFRSSSRDLAHDRALRLAEEVLALNANPHALLAALCETVEAMRAKRDQGDIRPLKNHNYLKRVLEGINVTAQPAGACGNTSVEGEPSLPTGRRALAISALQHWGEGSVLRTALANGLAALVALSRPGTPAADTICLTADLWHGTLRRHGLGDTTGDVERVIKGFSSLLDKPLKEWPEPAALLPHIPRRRHQPKLAEPRLEVDHGKGLAGVRGILESLEGRTA